MEEVQAQTPATVLRKRKKGMKKRRDSKKIKGPPVMGMGKKNKVSEKMQRLFRKRAKEYNSDDDDETIPESMAEEEGERKSKSPKEKDPNDVGTDTWNKEQSSSDEEDEAQAGITKFAEGCKAFRAAFSSIMKSHVDDETLGPVLSARKKFVVSKLAQEDAERKVKREAKKEKHLIEEKGHTKPGNFLDSHEKFLIGVATKGVVKLFNAVNKAQHAQKGLNPSKFKDTKALTKRRKEVFLAELSKTSAQSTESTGKGSTFKDGEGDNQPAWAPLRDTYMLRNSKLKDWDKMAEETDT